MPIAVSFIPKSMYTASKKQILKKARIVSLVRAFPNMPPTAVKAVVVSGWHTSRSDYRVHATVDFYDSKDKSLGREHIVESEEESNVDSKKGDKSK